MHTGASASGTQNGETFPRISWSSDKPWSKAGIWTLLGPPGLAGVLPGGPVVMKKQLYLNFTSLNIFNFYLSEFRGLYGGKKVKTIFFLYKRTKWKYDPN